MDVADVNPLESDNEVVTSFLVCLSPPWSSSTHSSAECGCPSDNTSLSAPWQWLQ